MADHKSPLHINIILADAGMPVDPKQPSSKNFPPDTELSVDQINPGLMQRMRGQDLTPAQTTMLECFRRLPREAQGMLLRDAHSTGIIYGRDVRAAESQFGYDKKSSSDSEIPGETTADAADSTDDESAPNEMTADKKEKDEEDESYA